ncbi:IQ calmodulin-binding motif-containing protein 1 [Aplochiton taeniatus]
MTLSIEDILSGLRKIITDTDIKQEQKVPIVLSTLQDALSRISLEYQDPTVANFFKQDLLREGILQHCADALKLNYDRVEGGYSTAAHMAEVLSTCCVGVEPVQKDSEAFHRLLLPSITGSLLLLANRLSSLGGGTNGKQESKRPDAFRLFRKVMESLGWLLKGHDRHSSHVLKSKPYYDLWLSEEDRVVIACISMWHQICTANSEFVAGLSHDTLTVLLEDTVHLLGESSDAVGEAAVRLVLLISLQHEPALRLLLDKFIVFPWCVDVCVCSQQAPTDERVCAACVIQAAWRAHRTRRRVRSLPRAVSTLQRSFRERRRRCEERAEAVRRQEEQRLQVCVRRQRARREFHQKQLELLHLLPPGQVQRYLAEVERQAALIIQRVWRGHRQRRAFCTSRHALTEHRATVVLQRAVLRFLGRRRTLKAPAPPSPWAGLGGLPDRRRAELQREVDEHLAAHPSSVLSVGGSRELHGQVQGLLGQHLQDRGAERRRQTHADALLAQINSYVELLTNAPSLSEATEPDCQLFRSRSAPVAARARQSHNALLRSGRRPWWRTLGDEDVVGAAGAGGNDSDQMENVESAIDTLYLGGC